MKKNSKKALLLFSLSLTLLVSTQTAQVYNDNSNNLLVMQKSGQTDPLSSFVQEKNNLSSSKLWNMSNVEGSSRNSATQVVAEARKPLRVVPGGNLLGLKMNTDGILVVGLSHVDGSVDPVRDIEVINLELVFADMDTAEKRATKCEKLLKTNDKRYAFELTVFNKIKETLEKGKPVRSMEFTEEEQEVVNEACFLTAKPMLYVANMAEEDVASEDTNEYVKKVREFAASEGAEVICVAAKIEEEVSELDGEEKKMFLEDLGIKESGLDKLIKASYTLLGLISYLTAGEPEVRAWTISNGTVASKAAGKIHTDFEKGFIRAEIVAFDDLMACGSMAVAKEKGLVRSEGRDYVMKDGDICLFRFNV